MLYRLTKKVLNVSLWFELKKDRDQLKRSITIQRILDQPAAWG